MAAATAAALEEQQQRERREREAIVRRKENSSSANASPEVKQKLQVSIIIFLFLNQIQAFDVKKPFSLFINWFPVTRYSPFQTFIISKKQNAATNGLASTSSPYRNWYVFCCIQSCGYVSIILILSILLFISGVL